jgi:hypothetical protein
MWNAIREYPKTAISLICAVAMLAILVIGCLVVGKDAPEQWLNLAFVVLGLALGWVPGAFLTPRDAVEDTKFKQSARALSVFVSGYLVAKIGKLVDATLEPSFFDPTTVFRMICVVVSTVLSMSEVIIFRSIEIERTRELLRPVRPSHRRSPVRKPLNPRIPRV